MSERWSFWRWLQESRKFMAHKPAWWVYPRAAVKWPAFRRQQLEDERRMMHRRNDAPTRRTEALMTPEREDEMQRQWTQATLDQQELLYIWRKLWALEELIQQAISSR